MINFVIIAELRSGYQMVATAINSHPKAFCFGEIFGSDREVRKKSRWRQSVPVLESHDDPVNYTNILTKYAKGKKCNAVGFKLNYVCARNENWCHLWKYMVDENWRFVHLTRRNLLNRFISQRIAEKENNWAHKTYESKISIDPANFLITTARSLNWQNNMRDFLQHSNVFELVYEDLQDDLDGKFAELQKFLGLKARKLTTSMIKQQVKRQSQVVENYRELYRVVLNNRPEYVSFFEDILLL